MPIELDEKLITRAIESALLAKLKDGSLFTLNYQDRPDFSPYLKDAVKRIDYNRVMQLMTENLEEVIAEKVVNKVVTEMSNDIKALMAKAEIRDDFRYFMHQGVETLLGRVKKKTALDIEKKEGESA
jgi:uncharacterized membrane protein YheB (UPF0754 family)